MAEGGETTNTFDNPAYDPWGDDDDDGHWDDDDDFVPWGDDDDIVPTDDDFGFNETTPFYPNGASTPAPSGEQIEMQTMQKEQSGLPLLSDFFEPEAKEKMLQNARDKIKNWKPKANLSKLGPIGFRKKGNESEIVVLGPKGGETRIFKKDGSGFLKSFTEKFSRFLGPDAEDIIKQYNDNLQEQGQRQMAEDEELERQAKALDAKNEKEEQEMQNLIQKTEKINARIDALPWKQS